MITGAAGLLGRDLVSAAAAAGHDVRAFSRAQLDVTNARSVERAVRDSAAEVIVNCAGWTDVDGAEGAPAAALAVNGSGAANVARAAAAAGAWMLHVSTDYVFDGRKREPYVESDSPAPLSAYGRSKLAGERLVAEVSPRHTIVRSSWLFGTGGPCFPATILRLAGERAELTVVEDQRGCPTFTGHLASALVTLLGGELPRGIVHVAGAGSCSWFQLAQEIVARARLSCDVKPGRTDDLRRPAARPAYCVLASERAEAPRLPQWREGVAAFMAAAVPAAA